MGETPCAHTDTKSATGRGRVAALHALCARASRPCSNATHSWCTCAEAMEHCSTPRVHVLRGRGALLHTPRARAPRPRSTAPHPASTCSEAAEHCSTPRAHVLRGRGALLHTPRARAPRPRSIAPHPARTCSEAAEHCSTPRVHVHQGVRPTTRGRTPCAPTGERRFERRSCLRHDLPMQRYGWVLLTLLVVCPLRAANPTWVQYAPGGTLIARTILPANSTCPSMSGTATTVRGATTDVTVCEAVVPAGTTTASINGVALPLKNVGKTPKRIAVVGDTGCRVKCSSSSCSIQDCSDPAQWPAAAVAKSIAAWKPDLIVHVGDYYYREYNCPSTSSQPSACSGPVYTWANWTADFFTPMAKLLPAAPWIFIRGNHEICSRAGAGWFQYLDGGAYASGCATHSAPYSVTAGAMQFLVMDSSAVSDEDVVA